LTRNEKLYKRLMGIPTDFSYREAQTLLKSLGFSESHKGKASGSRVCFYREHDQRAILLHKPHPGSILRVGAVRQLAEFVKALAS